MKKNEEIRRLGDLCEVIAGQSPEGQYYNTEANGLPFYQGKKDFGEKFIGIPTTWTSFTTKIAKKNDILMSVRAPVGPVNFAIDSVCIGRGLAAIRCKSGLDHDYLYYSLLHLQPEITGKAGAVFPSISKGEIEQLPIRYVPLQEQKRIVSILDEAFAAIAIAKANAEKNLQNAKAVFDSYLDSVFSKRRNGWVSTTVGDVTRFIDYRGKTPIKTTEGVRLLTAKNIKMGYIQDSPIEFIAAADYAKWMTRGIPKRGDVLFTTEAPLANVAQLDTDEKVAFAQRVIIMQPDEKRLVNTFLKFALLSGSMQEQIRSHGTGATVQGIKASLLKTIKVSFPPEMDEQHRIVRHVEEVQSHTDLLVEFTKRKLSELNSLKASMLQSAFDEAK